MLAEMCGKIHVAQVEFSSVVIGAGAVLLIHDFRENAVSTPKLIELTGVYSGYEQRITQSCSEENPYVFSV
jgi:hypothetical protein